MQDTLTRLIVAMLTLVLAGLAPCAAEAQTVLVGTPIAVCLRAVHPGDMPRAMLAPATRFDCRGPQTAHGPGDFWVRATSLPPAPDATRLRTMSTWQRRATLWIAYSDGALKSITIDDPGVTRPTSTGRDDRTAAAGAGERWFGESEQRG